MKKKKLLGLECGLGLNYLRVSPARGTTIAEVTALSDQGVSGPSSTREVSRSQPGGLIPPLGQFSAGLLCSEPRLREFIGSLVRSQ